MGYMIMVFLVLVFLFSALALCSASGNAIQRGDSSVQLPHVYYITNDRPITDLPMDGLTYAREFDESQYMPELDLMIRGVALYDHELSMETVHRLGLVHKPREDA